MLLMSYVGSSSPGGEWAIPSARYPAHLSITAVDTAIGRVALGDTGGRGGLDGTRIHTRIAAGKITRAGRRVLTPVITFPAVAALRDTGWPGRLFTTGGDTLLAADLVTDV
jgi:hypothetical protein